METRIAHVQTPDASGWRRLRLGFNDGLGNAVNVLPPATRRLFGGWTFSQPTMSAAKRSERSTWTRRQRTKSFFR
jgi:hypothetical protein